MSADDADDDVGDVPSPHETTEFYGHAQAEKTLLDAYRSGRIPHAWLFGGQPGIGKATLAYRFARFVLAYPDPRSNAVQSASSLALPADHPVVQHVAAQAQADLLVLERTVGDTGKLRTRIVVDDVRRAVPFFGSTAGEGGWRVAVVDSIDELNQEGANALLKILEEPPLRSLLLLVSHAAGRIMPTIRSRCRRLMLRPLDTADVLKAAAAALGRKPDDPELQTAAAAAEGSVARALMLLDGSALEMRQRVLGMLEALPNTDPRELHALGEALGGTDPQVLATFVDTINAWLSKRLAETPPEPHRLVRLAEAWDSFNRTARDVGTFNLERKPMVFSTFGLLAEASRG